MGACGSTLPTVQKEEGFPAGAAEAKPTGHREATAPPKGRAQSQGNEQIVTDPTQVLSTGGTAGNP